MKCLSKYKWIKLYRAALPQGKGIMGYWARLAGRAAFRQGKAQYCGHTNAVTPGMWSGGIVGLKSILGVKRRSQALQIMNELQSLGYISYNLEAGTKKLSYEITDWVQKYSGSEAGSGTVYATEGFGFICTPRAITDRLVLGKRTFDESDAWLDLWCHTVYKDYGNAFSFLAPVIQYSKYGCALTLEQLGRRWGWGKTKVWRFLQKNSTTFGLQKLPGSYGCLIFNLRYTSHKGDSIDAALFDGLDYGNAFRRRRNQAICATLDKVREINLDIASAVDEKYYVEKEWISVNTMAIPAYDYEEEYTSSVLGAAIWMLDQIKEAGRVQELRNILEPANELTALLVPKIWDPCHDIDLIYSMVDAICNRNKQGEMVPYTYFRRTYMTEDIAEGKVDHSNPSRYRFDSILKLIPENSITRATEYYEALYWDWVRRFYLGRQVIVRDQMMFAVDYKVAMQDTRDAARMIRSTSEQIMQRNKGSLPGCRGIDLSEKIRFDVVQYELAIQNGYRVDGNMEQLGKRKEILDKQLIDYSHLVGFIPQKTEKANVSMFGREITDAWKGFVVSNPHELCFAFLHLLDTGSDLPWCYFAGVNLHTTYCASLPWPRMVHNDACDGVWKHYHPESGDIVLGPDPEKLSKKIRVPELEDWYSLQYEHSNTESEEEAELYNLSQIMFEATGCIMPRKLDRYHPALKVLDQYGITGKRALHPLLYCMSLLGEGKHQSGPVPFHHTDFGIEPEAQEEIPEQSVEDMQAEIKRLRAEVKDLRQQAYESSREVRDEKIRYEVLAQKAANDAQELHDLRELIFNLQDEEVSSRSINLSVAFPFRTTKKIIVFGGTEAWTKEMRLKLPDVTFVDRTTMPNSEMVKRADAVWIQTNALQHSHFYKIIEDVRKYNISLRYFSSAGVTKSAEQLASHLLRK